MQKSFDLQVSNLYDDGDYLWFTAYSFGALFRMNKNTMKPEYIASFEEGNFSEIRLYSDIIAWNEYLIFTPLRAQNIVLFNKFTKAISYISINIDGNGYIDGYSGWNYYSAQIYENVIYFFPHQRAEVLKLDLCERKLAIARGLTDEFKVKDILNFARLYSKTRMIGHYIYAPLSGTNMLQIIDLQRNASEIITISEEGATYSDSYVVGDNIYLSPLEGKNIAVVNIKTRKQRFISIHEAESLNIHYLGILMMDGRLFFVPEYHGNITILEPSTNTLMDCDNNEIERNLLGLESVFINESSYMDFSESEEDNYIYSNEKAVLIKIKSGKVSLIKLKADIPTSVSNGIMTSKNNMGEIIIENNFLSVDDFVNFIRGESF